MRNYIDIAWKENVKLHNTVVQWEFYQISLSI